MNELLFDAQVLLLNLSFIFLLFFIHHKYIEGKINKVSNEIFIGFISTISILLCMSFPFSTYPGFLFDYRLIPFIIGTFYGGKRVGFFLLMVLLSYRFMINLDAGFYSSILVYSLVLLFLYIVLPHFNKAKQLKRKLTLAIISNVVGILIVLTVVHVFKMRLSSFDWFSLSSFYALQLIVMYFFIYFIEKAKSESIVLSELKELEKLKVVSEIAASISHEVRNPLTVTKGFLQLLQDNTLTEEKREFYITLSLDELERAEMIISDYLTFAKPSLQNIQPLEINTEIHYILKVINPFATMKNVHIVFENIEDTYIAGERQKLHQCLINLAKNGIEAMPDGGILTIELSRSNNMAIISICDTGMGMNAEQIRRIGTPYYSTKSTGTGLGTMVATSIIKAMRGEISICSEVGNGTTFTIKIPQVNVNQK